VTGLRRLVVFLPLGVGACVWTSGQPRAFTAKEETELGRPVVEALDRVFPFISEPEVQGTVDALGQELAGYAGRSDLAFAFRIPDHPEINAFAVAGGTVYVYRGLLDETADLSEVAGILSHEIVHVTSGHAALQLEDFQRERLGIGATARGDLSRHLHVASYSRAAELEADSLAIGLMVASGWDPEGLVSFFRTMLSHRSRQPGVLETPYLSHPLLEDRIAYAERTIDRIPQEVRRGLRRSGPAYARLRHGLDEKEPGAPADDAEPQGRP